jgi:ribonuclease HI
MSNLPQLIAYADGSCLGNPGPGGWGVVLVSVDGPRLEFSGAAAATTNNRMEITAAIEALRRTPSGFNITIRTDSQYLVNTMTRGWKRRENLDLWKILDSEAEKRKVSWEWVRGHSGDVLNELADELARNAALGKPQSPSLDSIAHTAGTAAGEPYSQPAISDEPAATAPATKSRKVSESDEESAGEEDEAEIARLLRPLLAADETLRRCAGCHRAFVATGSPPRMRAYCSLAACQLKRRRRLSS